MRGGSCPKRLRMRTGKMKKTWVENLFASKLSCAAALSGRGGSEVEPRDNAMKMEDDVENGLNPLDEVCVILALPIKKVLKEIDEGGLREDVLLCKRVQIKRVRKCLDKL